VSANLIIFTGLVYAYIAFEQGYYHNNIGMMITYFAYAMGNVGLYMMASK
jgi:uncharacterized membrane protein YecN with MAPEG domain